LPLGFVRPYEFQICSPVTLEVFVFILALLGTFGILPCAGGAMSQEAGVAKLPVAVFGQKGVFAFAGMAFSLG
jgi:hypothetical protein